LRGRENIGAVPQVPFFPSAESRELAADIRELFDDLAASLTHEQRAYSGECHPSLDVLETHAAVQIVMDVCGVPAEALRVLFRAGVVIVAGEKAPASTTTEQTYHLVEREFGRFARAVRLSGAFDVARAHAAVRDGELTVVIPKLAERRDSAHRISIDSGEKGR
jgi:HSP20 family protein